MRTKVKIKALLYSLFLCLSLSVLALVDLGFPVGQICTGSQNQIAGTVYEDWNYDGNMGGTDTTGVANIWIYLTDCQGNVVDSMQTDEHGNYAFDVTSNNTLPYRLEFVLPADIAAWAVPTHAGNENGTMIQFVTGGDCANLGIASPDDYCHVPNPTTSTTCFVNGDGQAGGNVAGMDVLVSFNYDDSHNIPNPTHLARNDSLGAVWGLAYHRQANLLFSSAFLKRHAGLGPLGTGGLYLTDLNATTPEGTPFLDLQNIGVNTGSITGRGLPADFGDTSVDSVAFLQVGKIGLGDIDLSSDGNTLYIVNLQDKELIELDISNYIVTGTLPTSTEVTKHPIPDPGCQNSATNSAAPDDSRPFAIKYYRGKVYIGVTCSAESSQLQADLMATIYEFDPSNGQFNTAFNFSLQYDRMVNLFDNCSWKPWVDDNMDYQDIINISVCHTQPIVSDIEFDTDGAMILAIMDRSGHQMGSANLPPVTTNSNLVTYDTKGDILRAHFDGIGFQLENNAVSGTLIGCGAGNNQGPGGGEFFCRDHGTGGHSEMIHGGLALLKGSGEIVSTHGNPIENNSGGIVWFNRNTGAKTDSFLIYRQFQEGSFGKAAGLGDVELHCGLAPLEIGNYVWCDSLMNGIQDACERGIDGIAVQLYDDNGLLIGVTTTANGGQYYFNQSNVDITGVNPDGSATTSFTGLDYGADYFLVFGDTQFAAGEFTVGADSYGITSAVNAGANDAIDSDVDGNNLTAGSLGSRPDGLPFIALTTHTIGAGNHTYDLGVRCTNCTPPDAPVLSITDNDCATSTQGTITVDTACGTSSTIEYSTDSGNTWATTAPSYDATNSISVRARCVDDNDANCLSTASAEVTTNPTTCAGPTYDVSLEKTVDPPITQLNSTVVFTIAITNNGDTVTDATVTDVLPAGLSYDGTSYVASIGTFDGTTWTVGNMAVGATETLDITVTAIAEGVQTNFASIAINETETDTTNNQDVACVSVPVEICDDGSQAIEASAFDVNGDGTTTYQWYVSNDNGANYTPINAANGGTAQIYTISQAGYYIYTVNDGTLGNCGAQLCCPIIVETTTCQACPPSLCIPITIMKME